MSCTKGLQEAYWLVMGIVLDAYLGGEDAEEESKSIFPIHRP